MFSVDGVWQGSLMTESRVALVTGGARGIGAAVVRRLHAQGRRLAIADLLTDEGAELAEELDVDAPPYAFAPAMWKQVMVKLDGIVAAIGSEATGATPDGDDDSAVSIGSKQLAALLRQYV